MRFVESIIHMSFLSNMVSFIVFDDTNGKLLFQHCTPSLWNILDNKLHSFTDDDEYKKLSMNNQVLKLIF